MTVSEVVQIIIYFVVLFALTSAVGAYMAAVYSGETTVVGKVIGPIEQLIYRSCRVNPAEEMHWKKYSQAVLSLSVVGFLVTFALQVFQSYLPFNPQDLQDVKWPLAFNTAVSFVTNTNWQAYSGESTLSYGVQLFGLTVQNFVSAGTGMAVLLVVIRALTRQKTHELGNFWVDVTRSILYVLLPLSAVLAVVLVSQGVVQNLLSYISSTSLEGVKQILPMGPAASQIAIKQIGTNGGGFFGVNSAHPFENPTPLSNFLQVLAILIIPSAQVYAFGIMTKGRKHAFMLYLVMFTLLIAALALSLWSEFQPNAALGIESALEGKEVRFGIANSVLWSSVTTAASNGSVNAMMDSMSPIAGGLAFLQIVLGEVIFGGVGAGLYGMFLFVLLTVFLAGLMVGRTPEYMGKKLEAFEMKWALVAIVAPSAVVLMLSTVSVMLPGPLASVLNHGPHGLSEILYAFGSAAQNNGSAFGGLLVDTPFFNISLGIAMLVGRFIVIFSVLAICGGLVEKTIIPKSQATFSTDVPIFAVLLFATILIIGALTFVPAMALSSIVEQFLMAAGRTF
jgi:K+-transporting ATPase ATPase A chain